MNENLGEAEAFGTTQIGETVRRVTLSGGGLTASIMTWGAALQDLRLDGHAPPLVLGFPDFESHVKHSAFFGQNVGRFANRIGGARFTLDGQDYCLAANEGENILHGGTGGVGERNWTLSEWTQDSARFEIVDPDGFNGFPGTCTISCTYRLQDDGALSIVYEAESDRATLCNIAHHSYFTLDGSDDIRDHSLMVSADAYLPVRDDLIPTGEIAPVARTPFDFRQLRPIRYEQGGALVDYDHNFCLSDASVAKRPVAKIESPRSGVRLTLATTEPGLQFYTGQLITPTVPGLTGELYGPYCGFCLETQRWPDSPNQPGFAGAVLRPGETYRHAVDYTFTRG